MAKMASLHAEGITDLYNYELGKRAQLLETIAMVNEIRKMPSLANVSAEQAIEALLRTMMKQVKDE